MTGDSLQPGSLLSARAQASGEAGLMLYVRKDLKVFFDHAARKVSCANKGGVLAGLQIVFLNFQEFIVSIDLRPHMVVIEGATALSGLQPFQFVLSLLVEILTHLGVRRLDLATDGTGILQLLGISRACLLRMRQSRRSQR